LIKIILKVGVIWITCSRSLELDCCHYLIGRNFLGNCRLR